VPRILVQRTEAGTGTVQLDGRRHAVNPGQALVVTIPGPAIWSYDGGSAPWRFAFASITCSQPPALTVPVIDLAGQPALDRVFTTLVDQHLDGITAAQPLMAYQLLLGVVALATGARQLGPEDRLAERLATCDGQARIADLADELDVDHAVLTRRFTRRFGEPPRAWAERLRLRAACMHLAAGEAPNQAASAVGYADPAHFGRAFRRRLGLSPGAWAELPDMLRTWP
jgi:AraC-like DNA-binding protein